MPIIPMPLGMSTEGPPVSKHSVCQKVWRGLGFALAFGGACCARAPQPADPPITTRTPPACHIEAPSACRIGCDVDPPRKVGDVAPDLSGLDLARLRGVAIVEILIDERGDVTQACLRRGVREDVDFRVMAAVRQWRFAPVRLRHAEPSSGAVPLVMTVTVQIGR